MEPLQEPLPRGPRPAVRSTPAAPVTQPDPAANGLDFARMPLRAKQSPEVASVLSASTTALGVRVAMDPLVAALLQPHPAQDDPAPLPKDKNAPIKPVPGTAFGTTTPVSPDDVSQGGLGDCYLLSMMIAIARVRPDVLQNLVHDNGNGTYTVTLYEDHLIGGALPYLETVTPNVPVDATGRPLYAQANTRTDGRPLWPLLIEKAYAQHHGGYAKIEGAEGTTAAQALTKQGGKAFATGDYAEAALADKLDVDLKKGAAITTTSIQRGLDTIGDWLHNKIGTSTTAVSEAETKWNIKAPHEYIVKSVDKSANTIDLINPWGTNHLTGLPLSVFKVAFRTWTVVDLGKAPTP